MTQELTMEEWMERMRNSLKSMRFSEELLRDYGNPSVWTEMYNEGHSPDDALAIEMSYWEE